MKVCLITSILSPHQMPFAQSLANRLGEEAFRYIATERVNDDRKNLGWGQECDPTWLIEPYSSVEAKKSAIRWQEEADVIICGNRDLDCFEQRREANQLTFYMSERWFKPPIGLLRLLSPTYLRMALRFCSLLCEPNFFYLPIGTHAANDILRLNKLFSLFTQFVFRHPPFVTYLLPKKMLLWGYFVEPSSKLNKDWIDKISCTNKILKILWVGRMLRWKRVDILIKAVGILLNEGSNIHLTLIGHGPEEDRLRKMADAISFKKINKNIMPNGSTPTSDQHFAEPPSYITFHPPVPIAQVRDLLRKSDVYVLPSDGGEGWGAVLNEAMEEGCAVIATHECGSGATMIKDGENGLLFNAGDVNGLVCCLNRLYNDDVFRSKLRGGARETVGHLWNPTIASTRLLSVCEELLCGGNVTCYTDGPLKSVSSLVGLSAQTSNNRL